MESRPESESEKLNKKDEIDLNIQKNRQMIFDYLNI